MSSRKSLILTTIGFLLFTLGMMSLVLSMMDIRISFLSWIPDLCGRLAALVIHLSMSIIGLVTVVAARGNFAGEDPVPIK